MANGANLTDGLDGLATGTSAITLAIKEFKVLEEYAKGIDKIESLEKWDTAFYSEIYKKHKFNIDQEELKPYFSLQNVLHYPEMQWWMKEQNWSRIEPVSNCT